MVVIVDLEKTFIFALMMDHSRRNLSQISYTLEDLHGYIDNMPEFVCLVFNPNIKAYVPHAKQWIKNKAFEHLRQQVVLRK